MNGELADISSDIATMPPAIADALRPLIEAASALGSGVLERQVTAWPTLRPKSGEQLSLAYSAPFGVRLEP